MKPGLAVLPLEVWADIFLSPWFTRQELAEILNGTCNRNFASKLEKLLHGCGKPTLGLLEIFKYKGIGNEENPNRQAVLRVGDWLDYKDCEFPQCEMPENIKGFKELEIRHLDDQVLDFLDKLKPIFTNVILRIDTEKSTDNENMRILLGHLFPMLASIREIDCSNGYLPTLEQQFPGKLTLAKELSVYAKPDSIPTLLIWLSAPLNFDTHGPRFLNITVRGNDGFDVVDAVRKHFLAATTSSTFVLFLQFDGSHDSIDQFKLELKNGATKEQLTAQKAWLYDSHGFYHYYLEILRHPVGEEAKIREWIKQRAYFDKLYTDEQGQVISISNWSYSPLTIGQITGQAGAIGMNQGEENKRDGNNAVGPSRSSAKKTSCVIS